MKSVRDNNVQYTKKRPKFISFYKYKKAITTPCFCLDFALFDCK